MSLYKHLVLETRKPPKQRGAKTWQWEYEWHEEELGRGPVCLEPWREAEGNRTWGQRTPGVGHTGLEQASQLSAVQCSFLVSTKLPRVASLNCLGLPFKSTALTRGRVD